MGKLVTSDNILSDVWVSHYTSSFFLVSGEPPPISILIRLGYLREHVENLKFSWIKIQNEWHCPVTWDQGLTTVSNPDSHRPRPQILKKIKRWSQNKRRVSQKIISLSWLLKSFSPWKESKNSSIEEWLKMLKSKFIFETSKKIKL